MDLQRRRHLSDEMWRITGKRKRILSKLIDRKGQQINRCTEKTTRQKLRDDMGFLYMELAMTRTFEHLFSEFLHFNCWAEPESCRAKEPKKNIRRKLIRKAV